MDVTTLQFAVAGLGVPVVISLVRRFFPNMTSQFAGYFAVAFCMLVVLVFQLVQSNPEWLVWIERFIALYGSGQLLYNTVLKPTQTDRLIEGK